MTPETHSLIDDARDKVDELERHLEHQMLVRRALGQLDNPRARRYGLLVRLGGWMNRQGERRAVPRPRSLVQSSGLATDSGIHRVR